MNALPNALPSATRHQYFSFARIGAIASNTLLELIRLKVFYFILIFALVMISSSFFLVKLSFQAQFQVLKDVALGAMSIFTWLLAVLCTAMLLPKDIEDRTLYTILAKPVPRFEYLLGKLLGVLVLLLVSTLIMSALFAAVLYGHSHVPSITYKRGVLYFNPGSCGPRRFDLPVTVGMLSVDENSELSAQIVPLSNS